MPQINCRRQAPKVIVFVNVVKSIVLETSLLERSLKLAFKLSLIVARVLNLNTLEPLRSWVLV
jgi:hypothetical protein